MPLASAQLHNPLAYHLTAVGHGVYFIADTREPRSSGFLHGSRPEALGGDPLMYSESTVLWYHGPHAGAGRLPSTARVVFGRHRCMTTPGIHRLR